MKKSPVASLITVLVLCSTPLLAADQAATVTQSYNQVNHGSAQSTQAYPAKVGTQIHDGEYVKTGASSRAELQLSNQTITRLGANTIFNYSLANNEVDLQAGTMLFSKPKDGKQLNIKTAAVTAAIVGTTGFGTPNMFGLVEGKAHIVVNGETYTIHAGQILLVGPPVQIIAFDVPLFLKTSLLITGFTGPLPNQKYIDEEIADYNDSVDRGFIRPPKPPYFTFSDPNGFPTIPLPGHDSAGNALGVLTTPPPQQTYYYYDYGFRSAN